jgi:hypothetical protein
MTDRIEPIARATEGTVPPVAPVARREREQRREEEPRERRRREVPPAVTRGDDGTPHVDVSA